MPLASQLSAACGGNRNFEGTAGDALVALSRVERGLPATEGVCEFCESEVDFARQDQDRRGRQLRSEYRRLGESLAAKVWDDPKGRRIKFDIAGKPGLGLEIRFD